MVSGMWISYEIGFSKGFKGSDAVQCLPVKMLLLSKKVAGKFRLNWIIGLSLFTHLYQRK